MRSKNFCRLAVLTAVVVSSSLCLSASPAGAAEMIRLQNLNSGKYLAVSGGDTRDGANVIQWRDAGQKDILWKLDHARTHANECYYIYNQNSGKYLAVAGGAPNDGANVIQWKNQGQKDIIWCKR